MITIYSVAALYEPFVCLEYVALCFFVSWTVTDGNKIARPSAKTQVSGEILGQLGLNNVIDEGFKNPGGDFIRCQLHGTSKSPDFSGHRQSHGEVLAWNSASTGLITLVLVIQGPLYVLVGLEATLGVSSRAGFWMHTGLVPESKSLTTHISFLVLLQ